MEDARENGPADRTIAIAATFTAEPLEEILKFWAQTLELSMSVAFAPYNQLFQQLLDRTSLIGQNVAGLNVLLIRWEDWLTDTGVLDKTADDLIAALKTAVLAANTPYLVAICPPSRAAMAMHQGELDQLDARVRSATAELPGVHLLTGTEMLATYLVVEYDDPAGAALGHVPYTPLFFAALGTLIARRFYALHQTSYKVLALDCDETLWSGVCGEVGPEGIDVDPPHKRVQELAVRQQQAGMLLCLCSKNNEEDVVAVFDRRSHMPLTREHLVGWRINWQPKSSNLRALASELDLGLDSFIFLDDDPVACAEVEASCPDVLTLQLPRTPGIETFLSHVWAFDRVQQTQEDAQRTELYRQNVERERWRQQSFGLDDFFANLGLDVQVQAMDRLHLPRVAQLTQRTNQFNCTTIRRTEEELAHLFGTKQLEGLVVEVSDRFGSYGLVGVLLFQPEATRLNVDTFLLSCRALGRGVEHRMLASVGDVAKARGCEWVDLPFRRTGKNSPALEFLTSLPATRAESEEGAIFRLSVREAVAVRFTPPETGNAVNTGADGKRESRAPIAAPAAPSRLMRRIATELSNAEQIRRAVDAAKHRSRPELAADYVAPRTELEIALASLWSQLLGVDRVGIHDDFFALGGHSLLATLLVSRIRDRFVNDMSLGSFFERATVAGVAEWIEQQNIQQASPEELTEILRALEDLSDAEVDALLAAEPASPPGTPNDMARDEVPS